MHSKFGFLFAVPDHPCVAILQYHTNHPKLTKLPTILTVIGDRIRRQRLELRLTQEETAHTLKVAIGTFIYWEDNIRHPRPMFIPHIITFLG